jgi:hypothetical protein
MRSHDLRCQIPCASRSPLSKGAKGDVASGDTCRLYSCHVCRINLHMLGYVARLSRSCTPNEAVTLQLHRPIKMFSTARLAGTLRSWRSTGSAMASYRALHLSSTCIMGRLARWPSWSVEALCALREVDNGTREEATFYRAEEVDAMIRVWV